MLYINGLWSNKALKNFIHLNDVPVVMEVDKGSSLTVVNEKIFNEIKANCESLKLEPTKIKFLTFTGEIVPVLGETKVSVASDNQKTQLPLFVVTGNKPCLLGRNWLQTIRRNWSAVL